MHKLHIVNKLKEIKSRNISLEEKTKELLNRQEIYNSKKNEIEYNRNRINTLDSDIFS